MYFHGTNSQSTAEAILSSGELRPPNLENDPRGLLLPRDGCVYLAQDVEHALRYALDVSAAGLAVSDEMVAKHGPLGYVFGIRKSDTVCLLPDEDDLGEAVQGASRIVAAARRGEVSRNPYMLNTRLGKALAADVVFCERLLEAVKTRIPLRDYEMLVHGSSTLPDLAGIAKRVVDRLPPDISVELMKRGAHLAHEGEVPVSQCWRFDKRDADRLSADGSNFFDLAEVVDVAPAEPLAPVYSLSC